jgi:hypothetical protein
LGLLVNDVVGARDGIGGGFFSLAPSTWPVPLTITWLGAGGGVTILLLGLRKCSPSSIEISFMTRDWPVFLIRLTTWRWLAVLTSFPLT